MTDLQEPTASDVIASQLIERAHELVPYIREHAREAEIARQPPFELIERAADAQLLEMLVPKRFGGLGLELPVFWEISRILVQGDLSSAWTLCFLIEHNWMACHMPMQAQEELYADRNYILAAGPISAPSGKATRVDGGWNVGGAWKYASAVPHADWALVPAMVDEDDGPVPYVFMLPRSDFDVLDDWYVSGLTATGSATITAEDVFVPEHFSILFTDFFSATGHGGVSHEDSSLRWWLPTGLTIQTAAFAIGSMERVLELGRERLDTSRIFGVPRIEFAESRIRWGQAHQKVRQARLLYDDLARYTTEQGEGDWPTEKFGQHLLDLVTLVHTAKDVVRQIADGAGSSAFGLDHPLQRYLRDVEMLATHVATDYDSAFDRATRSFLGLPGMPTDPGASHGPRSASTEKQ